MPISVSKTDKKEKKSKSNIFGSLFKKKKSSKYDVSDGAKH
jgi:hypothetical protein